MLKTDVLILGAGLAGMSAAYHLSVLGRKEYLLLEAGDRVGGTSGSVEKDRFLFDYTGHLLHLHTPYGRNLILGLLGNNLSRLERDSWIYSHGIFTRYPFQANTYGLPAKVIDECVVGFLKARRAFARSAGKSDENSSFRDWALALFGKGICDHFMFPYNEKVWRLPLSSLTTEWQGRFVPMPTPEEVLCGALSDQKRGLGYNAVFHYPRVGGIQSLSDALARRLKRVNLGARVTNVDLRERVVIAENVGEVHYKVLVNTVPLKDFLGMCSALPRDVAEAGRKLRFVTVYNLNIGVARRKISDKHWIYFPDKKFPFYRVGFLTNFSANTAPKGTSSMYIEISRRPDEKFDFSRGERLALERLKTCGLLKDSDRILTRLWLPISCGYVVYDKNRGPALNSIFRYLGRLGVESIGRYGAWKYSFMEEALLDGKACAERIKKL